MRVIKGYPPNYEEICAALGKPAANYMFTYGDAIYFPMGVDIPLDILAHEAVHEIQQSKWYMNPKRWWKRYLKDKVFRYKEELEAYRKQWQFVQSHVRDREMRNKMLNQMARDLSSANYGSIVKLNEAVDQIKLTTK